MGLTVPSGPMVYVPVREYVQANQGYQYYPATTTKKAGRIYFFHGLAQGVVDPLSTPAPSDNAFGVAFYYDVSSYKGTLVQSLNAIGFDLVLCADPGDFINPGPVVANQLNNIDVNPDMRDDPAMGARIINTILLSFDSLMARVNADHGWLPSVVMGYSWGGFTAVHIALARSLLGDGTPLQGYIASCCPTQLGHVVQVNSYSAWPFSTTGADLCASSNNTPTGTWTTSTLLPTTVPGFVSLGSEDTTVYPQGITKLVSYNLARGTPPPLATRYCDATISGTSWTSHTFGSGNPSAESGAVISGPGITSGTTVSGITDTSGTGAGPWIGTLSHSATATPTAVTAVSSTGTQVTYTAAGHGLTAGEYLNVYGFTNTTCQTYNGTQQSPSGYNVTRVLIQSVTTNTITINSTATGAVSGGQYGYVGQAFNFPSLGPGYINGHVVGYQEVMDQLAWVAALGLPEQY